MWTRAETQIRRPRMQTIPFSCSTSACSGRTTTPASVLPAAAAFKFAHFGHDTVVLHERDIRHYNPPFALLHDRPTRDVFMDGLNRLFMQMNFDIISAVVDKRRLAEERSDAADLYLVALQLCLEQAHLFLESRGQSNRTTHVVLESRGRREDNEMVRALSQNRSAAEEVAKPTAGFEIVFADKKTNSAGMQIADLTAGPIGRHFVRPKQANKAWALLEASCGVAHRRRQMRQD